MQFDPQRFSGPQIWPNSGTCASQHFLFFDNRRKIKSRKTHFVGRSPLSRLRRRFAPLRGTQRRCAALRAAPPGRYAPRALRAQAFCNMQTRKKCRRRRLFRSCAARPTNTCARPTNTRRMVAVSVVARGEHIEGGLHILLQARPMRPSDGWFNRLRRQPHVRPRDGQTLE